MWTKCNANQKQHCHFVYDKRQVRTETEFKTKILFSSDLCNWNVLLQSASQPASHIVLWWNCTPDLTLRNATAWPAILCFLNRTAGIESNTDPPFQQNLFSVTSPLLDPIATFHGLAPKCCWNNKHKKLLLEIFSSIFPKFWNLQHAVNYRTRCFLHVMTPTWCTVYLKFIQPLHLYMFQAC
jgi:hypothetical protein